MTVMRGAGCAVVLAVLVGPSARGEEKVSNDLKAMEGTWVSAPDAPLESRWVFDGETLKSTVNGQDYVAKIKLDAKASPRAVDFTISEGPEDLTGKTVVGIYKIDGDKLTICLSAPGRDERPTEFKAVEDETYLFELKREKKP
jgi:uncharacterized protein (TIGR03067 family)